MRMPRPPLGRAAAPDRLMPIPSPERLFAFVPDALMITASLVLPEMRLPKDRPSGADLIERGAAIDPDADGVWDGDGAGEVGADGISGENVVDGARGADRDAVTGVARDDVAVAEEVVASDYVGRRATRHEDADVVGQRTQPAATGADVVSFDEIEGSGSPHDVDAVVADVAGDDVALGWRFPPTELLVPKMAMPVPLPRPGESTPFVPIRFASTLIIWADGERCTPAKPKR